MWRLILLRILIYLPATVWFSNGQYYHHSGLHHHMSKRDLSYVFGVDDPSDVPEYDLVHPTQVTSKGAFLTHDLSRQSIRERRNTRESPKDDIYYNLNAFGSNLHLRLERNRRLLAPDFHVEVLGNDGRILKRHTMENCHWTGKVGSSTWSTVAVSNCNGLHGVAHVEGTAFFIKPVPDHLHSITRTNGKGRPHLVYRRASTFSAQRSKRSGKKETVEVHSCGTKDDPRIRLTRSLNETVKNDRDGPAGPGGEKYIESLVVVDPKMANFHGIDAAKQYALTACNIASNLLRDSTLGENPVNFVVSRMQILTTPQPGLIINHHAGNTLESFGKWAERNNNPLDNDENHYDYAALLTRYNICKDKNQPCDTLGLTRTRGMCNFPNSASVNQDNGLMLGMTIAHETGHCLGINHDASKCSDGNNIMSSFAPGKASAFQWSECSKNYIQQFLKSKDSKCLDDQPTKREIIDTKPFDMPGSLYDADQQCQLAYGEEARFCHGDKFLDQVCVKLWCEVPEGSGKCKTAQEPAADGTSCGPKKWCKRGQCIAQGSPAPGTQDGGWSKWSDEHSKCSRSCGGGVQYKERRCNNPRPKNGGKRCEGLDREYKLCNTNECPKDNTQFRNYQCGQLNNQMFNDQFYNWEWKPSTLKNSCVLGCFIEGTGLGFAFGNVIDGTNCDTSSSNKCIQGICKRVGCDNIIDSRAVFDRCGVCDGDGSSCTLSKSNSSVSKKDEMPRPASLLNNAVSFFKNLGFSVDRRGHISSPEHNPDVDDTFYWGVVKSGCSVSCGGGKEQSFAECRRADDGSPVNDARCDISKKPPRQQIHCNRQPCPPSWRAEGWEDCTKTCNGGNRTREVKCMQVAADGVEYDVDPRLCTGKKPATIEACNTMDCQPEWVAQPFGACSTKCGRGVQKRNVICMKTDKSDNQREVDESNCDGLPKPPDQEYCNVHNPCPGEGGCGGNLTTDAGSLTSPNFPSDYPNNKECIHSIHVTPGKVIKLDFHTMQIASPEKTSRNEKCTGDFVKIMDGECTKYRTETLYCGKDEPAPYISTGNKLCVKFFSDQSEAGQGFKASYIAVDRPENPGDQCGATLTAPIGLITSPNYPDSYPGNEVCNTTIKVAKAPLKLAFQAFDVGSNNCDEDYVMLQVKGTDGFRKLCGNKLPDAFNTASNEMTISFKSGPKVGHPKAGFVATYTSGVTPEELRQQTDKSGIKTFNSKMDQGLMNVPVAKDTIPGKPKPKSIIEIPKDIDVNFKPIGRIDSKDASKEVVDDISDSKGDAEVEDALVGKAKKLQNALHELDTAPPDAESGSGNGSGDGSGNDKSEPKKETQADETSGSGDSDIDSIDDTNPDTQGIDETNPDTQSTTKDDLAGKTKVLQQTIMKMKKEGLLEALTGSIINRGSCPDTTKLSCLNLLYSFSCNNDDDCFENGMTCCATRCTYGKKMCVPRVSAVCPLRPPYYQGYKPCKDSTDCGKGAICCLDMAGRHYCNTVVGTSNLI